MHKYTTQHWIKGSFFNNTQKKSKFDFKTDILSKKINRGCNFVQQVVLCTKYICPLWENK